MGWAWSPRRTTSVAVLVWRSGLLVERGSVLPAALVTSMVNSGAELPSWLPITLRRSGSEVSPPMLEAGLPCSLHPRQQSTLRWYWAWRALPARSGAGLWKVEFPAGCYCRRVCVFAGGRERHRASRSRAGWAWVLGARLWYRLRDCVVSQAGRIALRDS